MKEFVSTFMAIIFGLSAIAQQDKTLFNDQWKFHLGDISQAAEVSFNDQDWKQVMLPHDWSIAGPFDKQWASATGYLPGGIGWYRKTFTLTTHDTKFKHSIYFDGVYKNAEVWINGHYLGKRPNGFIAFYYDLSPYLKSGKNILAVKVDHSQFADARWYTGSGIYRNVYLIRQQPLHFATWGIAFQTPQLNDQEAHATVLIDLVNEDKLKLSDVSLTASLLDKGGNVVAQQKQQIDLTGNKEQQAKLHLHLLKPNRWSVEDPYLYTLQVQLTTPNQKVDAYQEKIGFRTFRFDANKGFFLNNRNMKLKGVCIHDDAGALGVATFESLWRRRLKTLKEGGVNAIRMSHNPHADFFYTLCDELGLLVMDEAFDEWEFGKNKWIAGWNVGIPGKDGYHQHFQNWAQTDVKDMIRRNRNRPSIILWSIGNEVDYPNDPYSHEVLSGGNNPQIYGKGYLPDHPPASRLGKLSKSLADAAKSIDSTRTITAALAGVVMSNTTTYPENVDVVGYNYQEYRYATDHVNYPSRIIYGSENGMQYKAWLAVDTNEYISGQFLWTGIDYLGEAGKWPNRSNGAGLLDLAGLPKPEYYFRQSLWSTEPMVYIGSSSIPDEDDDGIWSHKKADPVWNATYGDQQRITAFSNAEEVELFLNGKSFGKKNKGDFTSGFVYWDIPFNPGTLEAKAYINKSEVARYTIHSTKKAVRLIYQILNTGNDRLKEVLIQAVDEVGNPVYMADDSIEVKTDGMVEFRGMENGNHQNLCNYLSRSNQLYHGKILIYLYKHELDQKAELTVGSAAYPSVNVPL
ncbi:glycoside hydrolase family 2 TIM barrel-domain containing protein [Olivibacter sp. CPCC 100613]|uniref:sugar-binding domain-containing protein n=1 Tax=Olivibacter sp. CPCC 100613 TaxID=3079931 RepID=UPI002FFD1F45